MGIPSTPAERVTMVCSSDWRVELQAVDKAKPVSERGGQGASPGCSPNERKLREIQLHRSGCRALADHKIELIVFHRRIERFFNRGRKPMNLIDKQDIVFLEVRQNGGQVTRMGQHEAGGRAERRPHLTSNDMSDSGLPQPRRAIKDRVIERFVPLLRCFDTDPQGFFHSLLADVFLQGLRT